MVKRMFTLVLVFSFFNLGISLAFAKESQEEKDANQQRAVASAVGLVAFVGIIYMLHSMTKKDSSKASNSIDNKDKKSKEFAQKQNKQNKELKQPDNLAQRKKRKEQGLDIGLDFNKCGVWKNYDEIEDKGEDEFRSPELKLSYAF